MRCSVWGPKAEPGNSGEQGAPCSGPSYCRRRRATAPGGIQDTSCFCDIRHSRSSSPTLLTAGKRPRTPSGLSLGRGCSRGRVASFPWAS